MRVYITFPRTWSHDLTNYTLLPTPAWALPLSSSPSSFPLAPDLWTRTARGSLPAWERGRGLPRPIPGGWPVCRCHRRRWTTRDSRDREAAVTRWQKGSGKLLWKEITFIEIAVYDSGVNAIKWKWGIHDSLEWFRHPWLDDLLTLQHCVSL